MLEGLKKHGLDGKTVGTDWTLDSDEEKKAAGVLLHARFMDIGATCLGMRVIKTAEEIALTQRAFRYFDKIHAFSRDYVLERGPAATDFEIGQALQAYGISLMMKDIGYDGRPHKGVGMEVTSHYVRAGAASAYPHPNQFFFNKVKRGEPLYINTDIKLGGYGGEGYRNYLIAPWTPHQEKIWDVVAESVRIMVEEGHQPPFFSLGEETEIREGMMVSVEPGLYDIKNGIGVNPSDNLLITKKGAVLMSSVPYSKEWSFLTL